MKKQLSYLSLVRHKSLTPKAGFTIVELLVVIVVIGILAAISFVSYSGIANRAKIASIQSDLINSSKLLRMFHVDNGVYPATISTDCVASPTTSTNLCLRPSTGNNFTTTPYLRPTDQSFGLTVSNGAISYYITENSTPTLGIFTIPTLADTDPANWIKVGTQVWSRANMNVGSMVTGGTAQINNPVSNVVEKYCFGNSETNCTNYGGLYQWGEAMRYATAEGSQGICPANTHIPSDTEWKTLEKYLGMTQIQADISGGWRGTDVSGSMQGAMLKPAGSSGLNIGLFGDRSTDGLFYYETQYGYIWTSTQAGSEAYLRYLAFNMPTVYRGVYDKAYGFSIRCVAN